MNTPDDLDRVTEAYLDTVRQRQYLFEYFTARALERLEPRLPPMPSLLPLARHAPRLTRLSFDAAGHMLPLLYPTLLATQYTYARRARARYNGNHPPLRLDRRVALGTSYRIADSVARVSMGETRPRCWLAVPGIKMRHQLVAAVPAGDAIIHLNALATHADLAWARRTAAHVRRVLRSEFRPAISLLAHELFTWCLLWRVIEVHGADVEQWWITNHNDHWAILLDRVPVDGARIVLQHGMVSEPTGQPVKLGRVAELYVYDDGSERHFRDNVLVEPGVVRYHRMDVRLRLTARPRAARSRHALLLIGSPFEFERERQLVDAVTSRYPDMHVMLKPHPLFPITGYGEIRDRGVELIRDAQAFPTVDLVLSPVSTLGLEYAAAGVPVIWHADRRIDDVMVELEQAARTLATPAGLPA
jgi:hypothetical protein